MKTFICVCFLVCAAFANAGLIVPSTKILQGPSSSTTVVGPDGSAISAVQPGGAVVIQDHHENAVHAAPVVVAKTVHTPLVYPHSAPLVQAYAVPLAQTYAAPPLVHLYAGHLGENTAVVGPSGVITKGYGYLGYHYKY